MRPFRRINTNDYNLEQIQNNANDSITDLQRQPELNAAYVVVTVATSVDNVINHGLGRTPLGYMIVKKSAACDVWDSTTTNSLTSKQLILKASANATITLRIY